MFPGRKFLRHEVSALEGSFAVQCCLKLAACAVSIPLVFYRGWIRDHSMVKREDFPFFYITWFPYRDFFTCEYFPHSDQGIAVG
jgi:hypothetical protein